MKQICIHLVGTNEFKNSVTRDAWKKRVGSDERERVGGGTYHIAILLLMLG